MILTTIAIIWLTAAAVFVLALGMAAAKPVPQPDGMGHDFEGFSVPEDSVRDEGAPPTRLYCGRSIHPLNDRTAVADLQPSQAIAGQRGGMAGIPKANEPAGKVSF
jgi:hypothetical protein